MSAMEPLVAPLEEDEVDAARSALNSLTPRERQVVRAMGNGLTAAETAEALAIAERTVDLHRANIFRKLGVDSALHVVRMAAVVRFALITLGNVDPDWTTRLLG